ncbi:MAG TPA: SDR family NAD(P)-dependent oxidoreductase [Burkholderiales bacterium]|jgi:3-oxoacyl-[acyl-carrier protein] reductase
MSSQLEGKVALITGAARRNGRATALALAREGADVVINTRQSRDEAEKVRAEIERVGRKSLVCVADITDENAVKKMFDEISAKFGRLDILVNNAADRGITPFTEMTTAQWRHILDIVLDGSFYCSRAAIPHMLKNGWGRIVNISGLSHHAPSYLGRVHVSTAKAGLEGFTRGLAAELAKKNITVNCVCPGRIGGERSTTSHEMPDPGMVPPVGHLGVSEDIAGAVHFLCLPGSGFITGHTMHVNGGQILL